MLKSFYEVRWDNLRLYKVIEDLNRQLEAMREDLAKTREEDKRVRKWDFPQTQGLG